MAARILIAGGGTGGHIIPALAVARELVARHGAEVLFVGTERGLESRMVPEAGFSLKLVEVGPLNRVSLGTRLKTLRLLPLSVLTCVRFIREFQADAVFGVGGYASGPAMAAALISRVPTLAFEPNAVPGLANRLVGRWVSAAAVNFAPAARWFRNAEVTGIPVRAEFFEIAPPGTPRPPRLLVFGGSQGARILNTLLPQVVGELLCSVPGLTVLHQAGARHVEATRLAYAEVCERAGIDSSRWRVEAFLDGMAECFAAADLILARSGASTVAELAAAGRPALLIPFAAAADDHQLANAEVMVRAGAAAMLTERELAAQPGRLMEALAGLLGDRGQLTAMGERARTQAHRDAASRIAGRLVELAGQR
uniref:N-acetylglucosaminyl transferase n=1 Tax=mine drainage metagenome TaxID=410659 RepID=E6QKN6_9ZZZZ